MGNPLFWFVVVLLIIALLAVIQWGDSRDDEPQRLDVQNHEGDE